MENKIVLITGGANGLGFAYATESLRNGAANVAILDLANSNGEEAASKLNDEFGENKAIFLVCDVTKPQQLEEGFAKTVEKFGGLDIVINNAGIMDDSRWELMVNINYNAVVRGTLLGIKIMGKENGGRGGTIVNISSIVGVLPSDLFPIYAGTKFAVVGLSRSLALPYHYGRTGVRILTLCPSVTDTKLITESAGRSLDIVESEAIVATFGYGIPVQTTDNVAKGMIQMVKDGSNGSVWVVENDEPAYEIEVPDFPPRKIADKKLDS